MVRGREGEVTEDGGQERPCDDGSCETETEAETEWKMRDLRKAGNF